MFIVTMTSFSYIKPKQIVKYIRLKYLEIYQFITEGAFTHSSTSGSRQNAQHGNLDVHACVCIYV